MRTDVPVPRSSSRTSRSRTASAGAIRRRFSDLDEALAFVHAVFKCEAERASPGIAPPLVREQAKLVLHEWIANLAQHADFQGRTPDVLVTIWPAPARIRCAVEDNSAGFDLAEREDQPHLFSTFPERGMGLQLILSCAQDVSYKPLAPGHHRFEFLVSAD